LVILYIPTYILFRIMSSKIFSKNNLTYFLFSCYSVDMMKLRKKEKKEFINKLRPYVGSRLKSMKVSEGWTLTEISREIGIAQSHLSEMLKHKKYPEGGLNQNNLIKLLRGGIVSTDELKRRVSLNNKELNHLNSLSIHEDKALVEEIMKLRAAGSEHDPVLVLRKYREENNID